jgi:hypothetical protein
MNATSNNTDNRKLIIDGIKALFRPGDTVEVRAFNLPEPAFVGRYKYGPELVNAIMLMDNESEYAIYYVLNPTTLPTTPLLTKQLGSKQHDIAFRRWFLLDGDPIREQEIATDAQYKAADEVMSRAKAWLLKEGWDRVVKASSGNGVHLLVPCDLPNDFASKELIRHVQNAVSQQFSTDEVIIEMFPDADRLVRAYGTLNRKGKETRELRWRRSRVCEL